MDDELAIEQLLQKITGAVPSGLKVRPSSILQAGINYWRAIFRTSSSAVSLTLGNGVFAEGKTIERGSVVAIYPGTVYMPWEPILLPSICNQYVFRLSDGTFLDGKGTGISRRLFFSSRSLGHLGDLECADHRWLLDGHASTTTAFAVGQMVNNARTEEEANVMYHELQLTDKNFPIDMRQHLPCVLYRPFKPWSMRVVLLIATKAISHGNELFSIYIK